MKPRQRHEDVLLKLPLKNKRGAVLVLVAILMVVIIAFAGLAIDVGYMMVTRNQLQNDADATALASARELAHLYEGMTPSDSNNYTCSDAYSSSAHTIADTVASMNTVNNVSDPISQIEFGKWYVLADESGHQANTFYQNVDPPNAVKTILQKTTGTFVMRVLGISSYYSIKGATAALLAPCHIDTNALSPFVISIDSPYCTATPSSIGFNSSNGCGGWQMFELNGNDPHMQQILSSILAQNGCPADPTNCGNTTTTIPAENVGDFIQTSNGELSSHTWQCMQDVYNCMQKDGHWYATIPVVNSPCNSISNQQGNTGVQIYTFATIDITGVTYSGNVVGSPCDAGSPPSCIEANVVCNVVLPGVRGECTPMGTYGELPRLVDKYP